MDCWQLWMMTSFRLASSAATVRPRARSQEAFTATQPSCRSCKGLLDGVNQQSSGDDDGGPGVPAFATPMGGDALRRNVRVLRLCGKVQPYIAPTQGGPSPHPCFAFRFSSLFLLFFMYCVRLVCDTCILFSRHLNDASFPVHPRT